MESHILSESAAYFDGNFLQVNLEDRPKIEKIRDNLFFDLRSNFSIFFLDHSDIILKNCSFFMSADSCLHCLSVI